MENLFFLNLFPIDINIVWDITAFYLSIFRGVVVGEFNPLKGHYLRLKNSAICRWVGVSIDLVSYHLVPQSRHHPFGTEYQILKVCKKVLSYQFINQPFLKIKYIKINMILKITYLFEFIRNLIVKIRVSYFSINF